MNPKEYNRGYKAAIEFSRITTSEIHKEEQDRAYHNMDSFDYGWQDAFLSRENPYESYSMGKKMTRTKREILAWLIVVACVLIVGSGLAMALRYSILSCPAVVSGTLAMTPDHEITLDLITGEWLPY